VRVTARASHGGMADAVYCIHTSPFVSELPHKLRKFASFFLFRKFVGLPHGIVLDLLARRSLRYEIEALRKETCVY
jgi:hypothetical protein